MKSLESVQLLQAVREAEGYLELGMTDHALVELQRRGKLVHSNPDACYLLGETLREMTRYREAIFPLRRSVALRPDHTATWLALGWCFKRTGQIGRAIDALRQAVEHDPDTPILHYNLACYWSLVGDRPRAIKALTQALNLDEAFRDLIHDESDFDQIRDDPGFRLLTGVIV